MRTEKQRARHVARYLSLAAYEVDRFLSRACCHNHAMAVWSSWQPVKVHVLPFINEGKWPPGDINIGGVLELIQAAGQMADIVDRELDGQPVVNGHLIDAIVARVGHDMNTVMHAFVREPMLAARARPQRPKKNEPAVNAPAAKGVQ